MKTVCHEAGASCKQVLLETTEKNCNISYFRILNNFQAREEVSIALTFFFLPPARATNSRPMGNKEFLIHIAYPAS